MSNAEHWLALADSFDEPQADVTRWCWRMTLSAVRVVAAALDGSFAQFNKAHVELMQRLMRCVVVLDRFADPIAGLPTDSAVDCCLGHGVTEHLRECSRLDPMLFCSEVEKLVRDYCFRLMVSYYEEVRVRDEEEA